MGQNFICYGNSSHLARLLLLSTCFTSSVFLRAQAPQPEPFTAIGATHQAALDGFDEPLLSVPCTGAPVSYLPLCTELFATDLEPFETIVGKLTQPNPVTTLYGSQLNPSESGNGPSLLTANNESAVYQWIATQKALGVKEITVHVDFPILDPAFYWSSSQSAAAQQAGQAQLLQMQTYYTNVATWVASFGLPLIVQTQNLFPSQSTLPSAPIALWGGANASATLANFYNGKYKANGANPNYTAYAVDRGTQAAWIAKNMKPAYLSVIYEPDSEATNAGMPNLGTLPGSLTNLQGIMASYRKAAPPATRIGAGAGVWISYQGPSQTYLALDFDQAYASAPGTTNGANPLGLSFIDMHIYDITNNLANQYLNMATSIAQWVHTSTKLSLGMTEVWLAKESAAEVADAIPMPTYRNPYSFWGPLDSRFLTDIRLFTAGWYFSFETISYPQYLSANLVYANQGVNQIITWDTEVPPDIAAILSADSTATTSSLNLGTITQLGGSYYKTLVPTDTTAPAEPTNFVAAGSGGTASLKWSPSTDNTGVLYYVITRNGQPVQPKPVHQTQWFLSNGTMDLFYQETGLEVGATYTYAVVAVDAAGNISTPATSTFTMAE